MSKHEAFWRQARSDFAVFEVLARQDRASVPACHPLHYRQMAVEKLGKAAAIKMDPSYAERTHKPLSDLVRLLKRRDAAQALGYSDFKRFLDSLTYGAVPLLTHIQNLHPQVTPDGSNVESPWFGRDAHGAEEWHAPADEAFPLLARIWRGVGQDKRLLGFGVPCSTFEQEQQVPESIRSAFAAARTHDVAVMLHFDFHVAWQNRPDLWNWFDPKQPGYNPANRRNVEWFGWEGPSAKARYLNWGVPQRMAPPMCFTSEAVRAEWTRLIRHVVCPTLKDELATLQAAGKGHLFAGVLVGSEPTFDNYAHTDPETAKMAAEDGSPLGQLGYRALLDRGYGSGNPPQDIHQALAGVVQETVLLVPAVRGRGAVPEQAVPTHPCRSADRDDMHSALDRRERLVAARLVNLCRGASGARLWPSV